MNEQRRVCFSTPAFGSGVLKHTLHLLMRHDPSFASIREDSAGSISPFPRSADIHYLCANVSRFPAALNDGVASLSSFFAEGDRLSQQGDGAGIDVFRGAVGCDAGGAQINGSAALFVYPRKLCAQTRSREPEDSAPRLNRAGFGKGGEICAKAGDSRTLRTGVCGLPDRGRGLGRTGPRLTLPGSGSIGSGSRLAPSASRLRRIIRRAVSSHAAYSPMNGVGCGEVHV